MYENPGCHGNVAKVWLKMTNTTIITDAQTNHYLHKIYRTT